MFCFERIRGEVLVHALEENRFIFRLRVLVLAEKMLVAPCMPCMCQELATSAVH